MNWGSLLLKSDPLGVGTFKAGLSELIYRFWNFFPSLLYDVWRLIAWVVNGIEDVFRKLAGLNSDGQDMASIIINDDFVGDLFKNLVAFSTVMIIVFTIVKIVQEHYKEKDGGNPYKIVIRTFKGLLLFLFITSASLLGLEAAGYIFRGLDAATGGGDGTTVSGQVFQAMAAEANRKRWDPAGEDADGLLGITKQKYYYRVNREDPWSTLDESKEERKDGKYIAVQMTGDTKVSPDLEAVREKLYETYPEYNYGIVNSDGSLTPVAKWLGTQAVTSGGTDGNFEYSVDVTVMNDVNKANIFKIFLRNLIDVISVRL